MGERMKQEGKMRARGEKGEGGGKRKVREG
jgi:hypothetical protein